MIFSNSLNSFSFPAWMSRLNSGIEIGSPTWTPPQTRKCIFEACFSVYCCEFDIISNDLGCPNIRAFQVQSWKDQKCPVFNLSMPLIQKCCLCEKQSKMSHIVQNLTNFSSDIWCWIFPNFCLQHWFRLAKWFIAYSCSGPSFFTKNQKWLISW